jgi:hypothetical protein
MKRKATTNGTDRVLGRPPTIYNWMFRICLFGPGYENPIVNPCLMRFAHAATFGSLVHCSSFEQEWFTPQQSSSALRPCLRNSLADLLDLLCAPKNRTSYSV